MRQKARPISRGPIIQPDVKVNSQYASMSKLTIIDYDYASSDSDSDVSNVADESESTIPKVHYHREHDHYKMFTVVYIKIIIDALNATFDN